MGLFNLFKDNKSHKNNIEKETRNDDIVEIYNIEFPFYVNLYKNDTEKQELLSLITGQMSDGWGEGNFDYLSDNNDRYNVIFWKYNNWNINFI